MQFQKVINANSNPPYRAVIRERKSEDPCPDCSRMKTEVAKLQVMMSRYGMYGQDRNVTRSSQRSSINTYDGGMEPPALYDSPIYSPMPNARATEWETSWADEPDKVSPRSNISLHALKPGQEVSSQVKALYREIGRLERELELKQHEIDSFRNSNSRASKHDAFGNNGSKKVDKAWMDMQEVGKMYEALLNEEWREALSNLKRTGLSNKDCYVLLQNILIEVYGYCREKTSEQLSRIIKSTHIFEQDESKAPRKQTNMTSKYTSEAELYRKSIANSSTVSLIENYDPETLQTFSEVEQNVRKDKQLKLYINKCLEVTWYMCIQNPPMEIDNEIRTGSRFDTTKFQYFKIEGNKIDYVVWPILLSAKKGTVVTRGYADAVGLAPPVRPSPSNSRASNRK